MFGQSKLECRPDIFVLLQIPLAGFCDERNEKSDYIRKIRFSNFGQNAITLDSVPVFCSGPLHKPPKNISVRSPLLPSNTFP